jgi:hypothetical protein
MPRLVNYADRFDAVREAVYAITLRDGPGAIDMPTVARESYMSVRTLQRLIASAEDLPHLGLQWADRQWRRRCLMARHHATEHAADAWELLVRELVGCLPGAEDEPEDRRVWWALVSAFDDGREWARIARSEHMVAVEMLVAGVVTEAGLADPDAAYERERLGALVDGLSRRIQAGRVTQRDAATVLRRHLTGLRAPAVQDHGDAA